MKKTFAKKFISLTLASIMIFTLILVFNPVAINAENVIALPSPQKVIVNNENITFDSYNIEGNNYFKLRDLAFVLSGTNKQLEVVYANGVILLTTGKRYTPVGGEMVVNSSTKKIPTPTSSRVFLDSEEIYLTAYNIDGYNYFKLRDLMQSIDVYVGYDDKTNTITLDTSSGYEFTYSSGYKLDDYAGLFSNYIKSGEVRYTTIKSGATASALPSVLDNSAKFPAPGNQGSQQSCVAWAVTYLKAAQDRADHGWVSFNTDTQKFSPAYVYNQINGGIDEGSCFADAFAILEEQGVCLLSDMPYKQDDFTNQPTNAQRNSAYPHRAESWSALNKDSLTEIKNGINVNDGVVVSVPIYSEFNNYRNLTSTEVLYKNAKPGGDNDEYHAICLIGWDDNLRAFKFINSWGTGWGLNGYGYISYDAPFEGAYTMVDYAEGASQLKIISSSFDVATDINTGETYVIKWYINEKINFSIVTNIPASKIVIRCENGIILATEMTINEAYYTLEKGRAWSHSLFSTQSGNYNLTIEAYDADGRLADSHTIPVVIYRSEYDMRKDQPLLELERVSPPQ